MDRPTLAVWKFASCDGCQLSLLDLEDELLALCERVDLAYFLEASRATRPGPYTLSLVEGSITTEEDAERILRVRRESRFLVTIGACATAGGIQALRNFADVDDYARSAYPHPEYLKVLGTSTPISAHVRVDYELHGCPVNPRQLLEVVLAFVQQRRPAIPETTVCLECKRAGNPCILTTRGVACLGPVTHSGCGALCPSHTRGCYGCYGPAPGVNPAALAKGLIALGRSPRDLARDFRSFNAAAPAFQAVHQDLERHEPETTDAVPPGAPER